MDISELTSEQKVILATIDMTGQLLDAMGRMMTLLEQTQDRLRQLEEALATSPPASPSD